MRVAVPEHQGRIAPVFDTCRCLLMFLQTENGDELVSKEDWSALERHSRPARLKDLCVNALICGGISCRMEELVIAQGIKLVAWRAGEVLDVLAAFREGRIDLPPYLMPGRGFCRRRFRRGRELSRGMGRTMNFQKGE
jgi:predicted Fe-Mo cluster-binding NifX family protein